LGIVDLEDQEVDGKITLSRVLWGLVVIMGDSENWLRIIFNGTMK
jgi:hypothetical protein